MERARGLEDEVGSARGTAAGGPLPLEAVERGGGAGERGRRRPPASRVLEHPVVQLEPAVALGTVAGRAGDRWRVRTGRRERIAGADASVDPALLDEAAVTGARVVLDLSGEPLIAGVLLAARPLAIDRAGDVRASLRSLDLRVDRAAVVATGSSFVRVAADGVELYGKRVLTRAREVAKVLARLIALN